MEMTGTIGAEITEEAHTRFKDAPWYGQQRLLIVGAGGIGSWTSLFLARQGHTLWLVDHDNFEVVNMGGQLVDNKAIGSNKAENVRRLCSQLCGGTTHISYEPSQWTPEDPYGNVMDNNVICAVDNMKVRLQLLEAWYKYQTDKPVRDPKEVNVFIDGQLEAETAIIRIVNSKSDYERYKREWVSDEELPGGQCSFRATTHNAAMIAAQITAVFNNLVTNKVEGEEIREVPFKIEYELPTLTYTVVR